MSTTNLILLLLFVKCKLWPIKLHNYQCLCCTEHLVCWAFWQESDLTFVVLAEVRRPLIKYTLVRECFYNYLLNFHANRFTFNNIAGSIEIEYKFNYYY